MNFLKSNKWQYRFLRTVSQALIGFVIANIDTLVGLGNFSATESALIVGATMSLLSPLYAWLSKYVDDSDYAIEQDGDADYTNIIESEEVVDNGITITD